MITVLIGFKINLIIRNKMIIKAKIPKGCAANEAVKRNHIA